MYRENVYAIHIAMQFTKKWRLCNKNRQPAANNQNRPTSPGATVGLGEGPTPLIDSEISVPFFGNLAGKASCVDDKTVLFRHIYS